MKKLKLFKLMLTLFLVFLISEPPWILAQSATGAKPFKQEELEQMLAPIALYPDSLLTQILMASTYPLEIVQADRWGKQNKDMKGDTFAKALEAQPWDPSVKSLVNFPQVLAMMSEKLDWTQKLGDAFLAQQKDVMGTIQNLRAKAQVSGNLKTTKEQVIKVEKEIIIIESASPQVVYVPAYSATVVYGAWPYPAYPPYPVYPPPVATPYAFMAGVAVGAAWGYAWGSSDWHGGDVDINYNQNNTINNNNINREQYKQQAQAKGQGGQAGQGNKWQHDASHRGGASYRDQGTAQKYNRGTGGEAAKSRDAYRGRAEQGRQDLAKGGADQFKGRQDAGKGGGQMGRGGASAGQMDRGGSAFSGMDRGGSAARDFSSRGSSSRQSMSSGGGGFGGGGGGRGGGGGGRGGGGGGRGGGGGGRR